MNLVSRSGCHVRSPFSQNFSSPADLEICACCLFSDAAYSPIAHGSPDVTGGAEEKKDSEAKHD